jgi:hypothetical protein
MTIDTHLILVSAQPIPNLTPVLDQQLRPKKVIMLVSPDMQQRSQYLESIFKGQCGVEVERHTIDDPWDLEAITLQIIDIVGSYPANSIALNATGGTKPMALAAFDVFKENQQIFYVHPEQDRLIWLNPKQPSIKLADKLKLKNYLMAYGAEAVNAENVGVSFDLQDLCNAIIKDISRYEKALGALNYLALEASKHPKLTVAIEDGPQARRDLWDLLELIEQQGLCSINGQNLLFKDETSRFIANGGWLELYTYKQCLNLKHSQAIQDIARNISITRQSKTKNEIDIGLIKANRLHLIECKTKRYKDNNSADPLYKLDSLRDLMGGLQGKAMLVSFNQLDKASRHRAKELEIAICCHTELQNLQTHMTKWLRHER